MQAILKDMGELADYQTSSKHTTARNKCLNINGTVSYGVLQETNSNLTMCKVDMASANGLVMSVSLSWHVSWCSFSRTQQVLTCFLD